MPNTWKTLIPNARACIRKGCASAPARASCKAWLRSDLMALREDRNTEVVFLRPATGTLAPEARQAAGKLIAAVEQLLPADGGDLFGAWCLADTDLALMLKRLQYDDVLPPRLAAYAERQWRRPAVQDWLELGRRAASA